MNSFIFHEPKPHGTVDFPFEYHYVDLRHPRYIMPFHWHGEWEIIHILDGKFSVHADDRLFTAEKGDVLLIRDGMLHGGTPENCIYECYLFDLRRMFRGFEAGKKHLRPLYKHEILPRIDYTKNSYPSICASVEELSAAHRAGADAAELLTLGLISRFFAQILSQKAFSQNPNAAIESGAKIHRIKSVLEYIEEHYASSVTLDDLAGEAGMNSKYFCRFFRSITHQTPMEYVNMYRVEKAAQLLHGTELPVTEVGLECGFNDSSNFIKVFRKYKGITPKQYRKR